MIVQLLLGQGWDIAVGIKDGAQGGGGGGGGKRRGVMVNTFHKKQNDGW